MREGTESLPAWYVEAPEDAEYTFPDVGEQFFWRVIADKEAVRLELRQWRDEKCKRSTTYGVRGPFQPNQGNMRHYAGELFDSVNAQVNNLKNAEKWAGDYASGEGVKVKW